MIISGDNLVNWLPLLAPVCFVSLFCFSPAGLTQFLLFLLMLQMFVPLQKTAGVADFFLFFHLNLLHDLHLR